MKKSRVYYLKFVTENDAHYEKRKYLRIVPLSGCSTCICISKQSDNLINANKLNVRREKFSPE